MKKNLPISEDLDFGYLLSLMRPLYSIPEFAWLPELFALVGYESLIDLCKYAGGETIVIPTVDQLREAVESLQWFYNVYLAHSNSELEIPPEYKNIVAEIAEIYNVRNH